METIPILKALVRNLVGHSNVEAIVASLRARRNGEANHWSRNVAATYYYGVWLRHLVLLHAHGMTSFPNAVAEFGPGDSLGVGLSALLSGANRYCAFDAADFTRCQRDQVFVDQIAALFKARTPCPTKGWPDLGRYLAEGQFPDRILEESRLQDALAPQRTDHLKIAIAQAGLRSAAPPVQVIAPWSTRTHEFEGTFDVLLSHTVLQYLPSLGDFFGACMRLLRPGGWMSHQIDFASMGLSQRWNGHLAYSDAVWRFIVARRPFSPNRKLLRDYIAEAENAGFEIVMAERSIDATGLSANQVASMFRSVPNEELSCRDAFLIARKPL